MVKVLGHLEVSEVRGSLLSSMDPRAKLVSFAALIASVAFQPRLDRALLALALACLIAATSRVPSRLALRFAGWALLFTSPFLLASSITVAGGCSSTAFTVTMSLEGLEEGSLLVARALAAAILAVTVVTTSRLVDLLKAARELKVPAKLVQLALFSYRYLYVFLEDLEGMMVSARSRGFRPRCRLRDVKALASMAGSLLVRGCERAERVYVAMRSRGYRGELPSPSTFRLRGVDVAASITLISLAIALYLP